MQSTVIALSHIFILREYFYFKNEDDLFLRVDLNILFYDIRCMNDLPACVCVYLRYACAHGGQKSVLDPL